MKGLKFCVFGVLLELDGGRVADGGGLPLTPSERARRADAAASVVHDFIYGRNGVTKKEANEAVWAIHDMLRPLYGEQGEAS